jgi:hypothetical protein
MDGGGSGDDSRADAPVSAVDLKPAIGHHRHGFEAVADLIAAPLDSDPPILFQAPATLTPDPCSRFVMEVVSGTDISQASGVAKLPSCEEQSQALYSSDYSTITQ